MRILLVGNANSMWIMNFIDNVLVQMDADVYMLPNCAVQEKFRKFYKERRICLLSDIKIFKQYTEDTAFRHCLRDMWVYMRTLSALRSLELFDVINLHSVCARELSLLSRFKRTQEKLILSYYGSDLLRQNRFLLWCRKRYVKNADVVTFDNGDLQKMFERVYGRQLFLGEQYLLPFGLPILDIIKRLKLSINKQDAKKKLGISDLDTTIAIGYNGKPEQYHLDIISEIVKLGKEQKEHISLIIQLTYGGTEEYKKQIKQAAKESGCNVKIFEDYLSDEEVAMIRMATDIYINAQVTDAFSGSVCENMYAGCILLNAVWLMYEEFKNEPFELICFKKFSELPAIVQRVMQNEICVDIKRNEQLIWKMRSWEMCNKRWTNVLK